MDSILHKLMCLSVIVAATVYTMKQFEAKDFLGPSDGQKIGQLIGTTNSMNCTTYYIDTDNNMKTAEYISTIRMGGHAESQMCLQSFNEKQQITRMPLKKWREFSDTFQSAKTRF